MSRWLALLIAIIGGALLGYCLLWFILNALALTGLFSMVDGPPLPDWADSLFSPVLVGTGLACWALSSWLIWRALASRRRDVQ